ncbi:STAS domain-containing protein [Geomonas oryzisoli]|uniref:STAS domain-containing protein n=1 Tax=Geomonas oryzisoli TaxID=2847992 RepID=A0ABX8J651_9BACT|nr:STAS domain-containing protein [Geomonas oryzisoli]QWV92497.1 STAS domain-containing protein [Geomonas oryzisoli]
MHQFLVERLNEVTVNNSPEAAIDLARVSDIDACGCQLLALFMESLKRRGTTPVLAAVPATVRERIESLGFRDLLALQPEP